MLLRPLHLTSLTLSAALRRSNQPVRRAFVSFSPASTTHQTFHAKRALPYTPAQLYALIADIESYPLFLPYCTSAGVLTRTPPDLPTAPTGHPRTAALTVGWSTFREEFTSRVFCVPGQLVEAVSGEGRTLVPQALLPNAYSDVDVAEQGSPGNVFRSLRTRWEVREKKTGAEVELNIEAWWSNALLAAMSQQAAPVVADHVVEAFEARAREVLGKP